MADDLAGPLKSGRVDGRVVLPIGIGGKADRRVESEVGRHPWHAHRVEWQPALQPQQRVEQHETRRIEHEHGERVGGPVLLACLVDAGRAVKPCLQRAQHRRKEGGLTREHTCHIEA